MILGRRDRRRQVAQPEFFQPRQETFLLLTAKNPKHEFRVHYAGFFDPGFGYAGAGGQGSRAVLEVRSREVPFILEHGQIVGRLVYEKMLARPDAMYGQRIGSNYQAQGLKLSKHFRV